MKEEKIKCKWSEKHAVAVVLSTVPECHGVVRGASTEIVNRIEAAVRGVLVTFKIKDPLAIAENVIAMIDADYPDTAGQTAAIIGEINRVKNKEIILEASRALRRNQEKFTREELTAITIHVLGAFNRIRTEENRALPFHAGKMYNTLVGKRKEEREKQHGSG